MNLYLLSLLLVLNIDGTKTPNFYPSYLAAKEASKNYKKDLVLFFTKPACNECNTVWSQFEGDEMATKVFISTMIDGYGFDGSVLLDKYGLSSVPSWVVLDYEGQVKQKWTGEWKNPYARPTATVQEAAAPAKPLATFQATTAKTTPPAQTNTTATSPQTTTVAPVKSEPVSTAAVAVAPPAAPITTGFVLQAGYFGSEGNAQKLINDLSAKGFQNYSMKTTVQNGTTYFRVISKTYSSESEAGQEVNTLAAQGIKATIKKTTEIQ